MMQSRIIRALFLGTLATATLGVLGVSSALIFWPLWQQHRAMQRLKDMDPWVQACAALALGQLGPESVPRLVSFLCDSQSVESEQVALEAIGYIGSEAVPSLVAMLNDGQPKVRAYAAQGLGIIGSESDEAIPALVGACGDEDMEVRMAAGDALNRVRAGKTSDWITAALRREIGRELLKIGQDLFIDAETATDEGAE